MFTCPICGKRYKTLHGLRQHYHRQHGTDVCPCDGQVFRRGGIERHVKAKWWDDECHAVISVLVMKPSEVPVSIRNLAEQLLRMGYRVRSNLSQEDDNMDNGSSVIVSAKMYYLSEYMRPVPPGLKSVVIRYAICKLVKELTGDAPPGCQKDEEVFKKYEDMFKAVWEGVNNQLVKASASSQ